MEDKTLKHGPLTALITADEETGMYGAFGLKQGTVEGEILLNLDSEEEGELYIGCAGGEDLTATLEYKEEETDPEDVALKVTLKGLIAWWSLWYSDWLGTCQCQQVDGSLHEPGDCLR